MCGICCDLPAKQCVNSLSSHSLRVSVSHFRLLFYDSHCTLLVNKYLIQEPLLRLSGQCGRCRNIKGEPQIFVTFPSPRPCPLFLLGVFLWWALPNPSCVPNLKLLALAIAQILKGKPKILGSSSSPRPHLFFVRVRFYNGPWQTPAACQFWTC